MTIARKTLSLSLAAVILSTTAALAQGVGGADVPTDAKKKGEMEQPGSTGMSKGEAKDGMKKEGMMKKEGGMKKDDKM